MGAQEYFLPQSAGYPSYATVWNTLKLVFQASLIDVQYQTDSAENKPQVCLLWS